MKLYNTLSKKVEEVIPLEPGVIKMYTCGPTVYSYAHLGNMRTYIAEDLFEKTFKYLGYKVKRVMNITDVGHLKSDADEGEDKMVLAMTKEHKSSKEIADFYTEAFFNDLALVNAKKPETIVNATDEIEMYFQIITVLLEKGFAYLSNGNIYFDTSKYSDYYHLSGRKEEDLITASRDEIEEDKNKKNPADFVLWFTNSKFGNQELQWASPWGRGFPGWHIECSAISIKYLGKQIDLHFGAEDAVFPHHTNEIAQSEAYLGHKWCNYWVHLSWLLMGKDKMSKSLGHSLTISNLKESGYDPLAFRYFIINTYYHKQVTFSYEALDQASTAYKKLLNKIGNLKDDGQINDEQFNQYNELFKNYLSDDLNTANTITLIYDLLKDDKVNDSTKLALIKSFDEVLSLNLIAGKEQISDEILTLIKERDEAKKMKDFALADKLRQQLLDQGIVLFDTREGTKYEVIR